MKITIAGSGAMGCRFGGALSAAGNDVLLLDGWPEHVDAINASGLHAVDTCWFLLPAVHIETHGILRIIGA